MESKELQKKLENVCMYIFSFFFWYLVVAFFLKSNYPIYEQPFNRKEAYEALRDALTLSAYFLAPAIAYTLFSDWREEHKVISNVEQSRKFNQELKRCIDKIETDHINFVNFEESNFEVFMRMLFDFSATVSSTLQNIYDVNQQSHAYINDVELIRNKFEIIYTSIQSTIILDDMKHLIEKIKLEVELNKLIEKRMSIIEEIRGINLQPLKVN